MANANKLCSDCGKPMKLIKKGCCGHKALWQCMNNECRNKNTHVNK